MYDKQSRQRINAAHANAGVTIVDMDATYIEETVRIAKGVTIFPGNVLMGDTKIGGGTVLYPNNRIVDCDIGANVKIESSLLESASVGDGATIGPFVHLRPGAALRENVHVGNFVEVKNVTVGNGSKLPHLSYFGDGEIGERTNMGCGVVFCNYDGVRKHKTVVGSDCFIGCNANLVAPVTVGDGSYIAAGSTVTGDVPEDALCIARTRQVNKEGWAAKRRETYHK